MGEGPAVPRAVLIGEGPGAEEEEMRKPFCGPTGRQLDEELYAVGLPRRDLLVLNAMACRPTPGATEGMKQRATRCCRPALLAQLAHVPETLPVLAMGKWAALAVTGKSKGIMDTRGFIHEDFRIPRGGVVDEPAGGSGEGDESEGDEA